MKYTLFALAAALLIGWAINTAWPSAHISAFMALGLLAGAVGAFVDYKRAHSSKRANG